MNARKSFCALHLTTAVATITLGLVFVPFMHAATPSSGTLGGGFHKADLHGNDRDIKSGNL